MKHVRKQKTNLPNLRKYPRGIFLVDAKLKADGRAIPCATKNLTPEGVFIKTPEALTIGESIILTFTFPNLSSTLHVSGKVVRSHGDGVGVKFDKALPNLFKKI
jgi:Tfp pilus assembly protein PilZ